MGTTNTKSNEETKTFQAQAAATGDDVSEAMDTTTGQEQQEDVRSSTPPCGDGGDGVQVITKPLKVSQAGNESFEIQFTTDSNSSSTGATTPPKSGRASLKGESGRKLTKEELEAKLKAAEERRMSIEAERRGKAAVRLEDAAARRESLEADRRRAAETALEQRQATCEKNREECLEAIKEKANAREKKLEEAHTKACSLEQEKREETAAEMLQRQERARELRERQLVEKLERVVEHNEKVRAKAEEVMKGRENGTCSENGADRAAAAEEFYETREA